MTSDHFLIHSYSFLCGILQHYEQRFRVKGTS